MRSCRDARSVVEAVAAHELRTRLTLDRVLPKSRSPMATLTAHVVLTSSPDIERRSMRCVSRLAPSPTTGDPALLERLIATMIERNALQPRRRGRRDPYCYGSRAVSASRHQHGTAAAAPRRRAILRTVPTRRAGPHQWSRCPPPARPLDRPRDRDRARRRCGRTSPPRGRARSKPELPNLFH